MPGPDTQDKALSDEQLEAQVARNQQRRADNGVAGSDEAETRKGAALLRAAQAVAGGRGELADEEIQGALEYYHAVEEEPDEQIEPITLKLNVGSKAKPNFIRWTIIPVEDTEITKARKGSQVGTRAQRRRGDAEVDEALVSRKIVVKGTIDPDPKELAQTMGVLDPTDAIQLFFKRSGKTGLITQISGEILSISGWDDEDISEVEAARG